MRPNKGLIVALVGLVLLTVRCAGAATQMDGSAIEVSAHAGRLTVRILAAPLSDVLRAMKVTIRLRGDLTSPVTAIFAGIPLDEDVDAGVRREAARAVSSPPHRGGQ